MPRTMANCWQTKKAPRTFGGAISAMTEDELLTLSRRPNLAEEDEEVTCHTHTWERYWTEDPCRYQQ